MSSISAIAPAPALNPSPAKARQPGPLRLQRRLVTEDREIAVAAAHAAGAAVHGGGAPTDEFEHLWTAASAEIRKLQPEHRAGDHEAWRWQVVIDGTTNMSAGIPHWCVGVSLRNGSERVASAIYDPIRNETFSAAAGKAHLPNQKAADPRPRNEEIVAASLEEIPSPAVQAALVHVRRSVAHYRETGSGMLDMAWLACGRIDGVLQPEPDDERWEIAAHIAGCCGVVADRSTWTTGRWGIAGRVQAHDRLRSLVSQARES